MKRGRQGKGVQEDRTELNTSTTTNIDHQQPSKQPKDLNKTSVKSRVQQFTNLFSIPPNPPENSNQPPPPKKNLQSELAPLFIKQRRPSQNEVGDKGISCEGKINTRGIFVKTPMIGGKTGEGKIYVKSDQ